MSKSKIRNDKTCLNCRYVVENKFCPNCGQENRETRETFHHLFVHFFEDLTHYENAFWRTLKNLLFKPASLTKEYLSGKRLSYLPPVRLYIFISFVTFLFLALFPVESNFGENTTNEETTVPSKNKYLQAKNPTKGHIAKNQNTTKNHDEIFNIGYTSAAQLDSIQINAPNSEKLSDLNYWVNRKVKMVQEKNTNREIIEKFVPSFSNNLPKVLFITMPLFAFFLWLFHSKKRWYYFDHGIFTLHYFSFLLLVSLLIFLLNKGVDQLPETTIISFIQSTLNFIGVLWMLYYLFPAHLRFYGETRLISFIKASLLFLINFFLIMSILSLFAIYTFINLH